MKPSSYSFQSTSDNHLSILFNVIKSGVERASLKDVIINHLSSTNYMYEYGSRTRVQSAGDPHPPLQTTELETLTVQQHLLSVLLSHVNALLTISAWTCMHSSHPTEHACVTTSINCYSYVNVIEQKLAFIAKLILPCTNNSSEAASSLDSDKSMFINRWIEDHRQVANSKRYDNCI
jgi:hypothetical protein